MAIDAPPEIPHVLRVKRTDIVDNDTLPFVVLNVTAPFAGNGEPVAKRLAGTRVVATDGQEVYICQFTSSLVEQARVNTSLGTNDEWLSILAYCFFNSGFSEDGASKFSHQPELVASVDGYELKLTVRQQIGGILRRLGVISITATTDESAESEADILSWAASACQWATFHRDRVTELQAQLADRDRVVKQLRQDMDDLVSRHQETQEILLEKFSRVLNSKKRFIREHLGQQGFEATNASGILAAQAGFDGGGEAGVKDEDTSSRHEGDNGSRAGSRPVQVTRCRGGRGGVCATVARAPGGGTKATGRRKTLSAPAKASHVLLGSKSADEGDTETDASRHPEVTDDDERTDDHADSDSDTVAQLPGPLSAQSDGIHSRPARASSQIGSLDLGQKPVPCLSASNIATAPVQKATTSGSAPIQFPRTRISRHGRNEEEPDIPDPISSPSTDATKANATSGPLRLATVSPADSAQSMADADGDVNMDLERTFIPPRRELPFQRKQTSGQPSRNVLSSTSTSSALPLVHPGPGGTMSGLAEDEDSTDTDEL